MLTLEKLKTQLEPYKNTLVIDDFDSISRLVDVIEDEDDFYWVYDSKNGIYHSSCVIDWIPLKGFIEQEKYERLVYTWNLNNEYEAI